MHLSFSLELAVHNYHLYLCSLYTSSQTTTHHWDTPLVSCWEWNLFLGFASWLWTRASLTPRIRARLAFGRRWVECIPAPACPAVTAPGSPLAALGQSEGPDPCTNWLTQCSFLVFSLLAAFTPACSIAHSLSRVQRRNYPTLLLWPASPLNLRVWWVTPHLSSSLGKGKFSPINTSFFSQTCNNNTQWISGAEIIIIWIFLCFNLRAKKHFSNT